LIQATAKFQTPTLPLSRFPGLGVLQVEEYWTWVQPNPNPECSRSENIWILRLESPSGKCAKLHTVAASNNRDLTPRSLSAYASHYVQSFTC